MTEQSNQTPPSTQNDGPRIYAAIARDMELNGDVFTIELGFESVHVFWSQ